MPAATEIQLNWSEWENTNGAKHICRFGNTIQLTIWPDWEDDFWYIYLEVNGQTIGRTTDPSLANAKARAKAFAIETWQRWLEALQGAK